jgi:RNA polymerase-binding protein DksA
MALNKEILEELKNELLKEKARLEEELGVIGKPTGNVGDYETKFDDIGRGKEDNASEVEEYADNVGVEDNLESQLKEVRDALFRMENGTYGICENCGEVIDIERLRAYPAAMTCIKCK